MLNYYTGSGWVTDETPLFWNGTAWVHARPFWFDGLEWQPQAAIGANVSVSKALSFNVAGPTVPPPPPTQTYTKTWGAAAQWDATYRGDNSMRGDTSDLYQGYNTAYQGNMKSLVGFNVTPFPAGATCLSATLTLYANHWYNNGGGVAIIGTHNRTSKPSSYTSSGVNTNRLRYTWNTKTGSRVINLGTTIGQEIINGTTKGIVIGPAPSTSNSYYGYFEGTGAYRPAISIKYQYVA